MCYCGAAVVSNAQLSHKIIEHDLTAKQTLKGFLIGVAQSVIDKVR
jgi:hypothetical protein